MSAQHALLIMCTSYRKEIKMYLIVGLGNPEPEYSDTRHNMGFDVINNLSKKTGIEVTKNKFDALYGTGTIENEKVLLLKPQTYMNLSGRSIRECKNFFKIENDKIIVIYDDIDIEPGTIKIRKKGSAGSHNGMKSVINEIGTIEFPRIRVGTGQPQKEELVNYVLKKLSKDEKNVLAEGIEAASRSIIEIIKNGIDAAMNKFN